MPSSDNATLLLAQSQSEITHGMSARATFLELPDDVILEIAELCGSGLAGVAHLAANVPAFGHVHRRFQGVIREDFWKNWCRRKGYSIPAQPHWNFVTNASLAKLIDEKTTGEDARQTNPWARWDIRKRDNSLEHQSARLLSPQDVISSGLPLTWRITHSNLQRSLRSLHAELISHRTRLLETDCSKRNHVLITSLVGSAERNIQDGPCRYFGDDDVLALGSCRIVTAPAVTGVMLPPEFFCAFDDIPEEEQNDTLPVANSNGVTLLDCLHAIGQWLAKHLPESAQNNLWNEHHSVQVRCQERGENADSRYQILPESSRTTRQAVKEHFFMDHALRLDLGLDSELRSVEAITSKGSIVVRLV